MPRKLNVLTFLLQLIVAQTQVFSNEIHTQMTESELHSTFGSHHDQIPQYEAAKVTLHHVNRRHLSEFRPNRHNYHLLAVVQTANATMHLQLTRRKDVVASTFEIEVHHHNYTEVITADQLALPECLFHGRVKQGGQAAVSTCSEKGMIGLIISRENHYILQPIPPRLLSIVGVSHVMYRKTDPHFCPHKFDKTMVAPEEHTETDDETTNRTDDSDRKTRTKRASSSDKVVETAVFVDDVMYASVKKDFKSDTVEAIRDIVFTMINAVQLLYNQPNLNRKFKYVLVKVAIITSASKGPGKASGDIKNYLLNFCKWQSDNNPGNDRNSKHWDNAIMLSGLNLYQGSPSNHRVIGLAWVSGMCRPTYSCCINEGNNFETVFVISHELGHNLGMHHDGDNNKCSGETHIMSPSLGPGKIRWSSCSKSYLDNFVKQKSAACLSDAGTITAELNHVAAGGLPGERFDIKDQCRKAFGKSFVPHTSSKKPFDSVCRELWCLGEGYVKRAHPALDGSACATNKICRYGDCVKDDRPASQRGKSKAKGNWREEATTKPTSFFGKVKGKAQQVWDKIKSWGR